MEEEVKNLLARLHEFGGRIEMADGVANLVLPSQPFFQAKIRELLPDLARLRTQILLHCQGLAMPTDRPGEWCEECSAVVYGEGPEVVRLCRMLMCPYWRKGCTEAPDWLAEERNKEEYRRRGKNNRRAA